MNTTNTTTTESTKWIVAPIVGFCLSVIIASLHCCSIYASVKSKELKKLKFLRLALFLSLSDCAIAVEFMYGIVLYYFDNGGEAISFQCMLIRDIISGTVLSSLSHTLLICFDRLNATFTTKRKSLNNLTGNISVGLCFAIPHSFALVRFGINASINGIVLCNHKYTTESIILLTHDIPVLLLVASIAGVYGVVARRMIKQQKRVGVHETTLTETQREQKKANALRMRKNMATLAMIITIVVISAVPRTVIGLYMNITDNYDTLEPYFQFSILLMLLTPILDPIVYLFRIQKYREQIICKCCRSNTIADAHELQ